MVFVHCNRILHRDLKPQNILVSSQGVLKLSDFGQSRTFIAPYKSYTHEVVTLWYRPPEIQLGGHEYDTSVDIWSAACIIAELKLQKPLITGDSEIAQLFRIFHMFGTPTENTWPGVSGLDYWTDKFPRFHSENMIGLKGKFKNMNNVDENMLNLLEKMFALDPNKRINGHDILDHPFLNQN